MTDRTFDIYVDGQYSENYGAHDWNGEGECPQYWKFKGGNLTKVQENVSLNDLPKAIFAIEARIAEFGYRNDYSSFCPDSVSYLPHGATAAVEMMVEYGLDARYSHYLPVSDEEVEMARWFRNFMGMNAWEGDIDEAA